MTLVGKSVPRKEGRQKVTGQALYVDDLQFDGMLHGVTVRSSISRGRIKGISFPKVQRPATAGRSDFMTNLWNERSIERAIDCVINGQGDDLPDFDD
jgi:xanthine dehydrogenase molybdopterin-binding subunit B